MTSVTWGGTGTGDPDNFVSSQTLKDVLLISAHGVKATYRVLKVNEILSGISRSLSACTMQAQGETFVLCEELLRALDTAPRFPRLSDSEEVLLEMSKGRFEELRDDGGGGTGKKKQKSKQNESGNPSDSSGKGPDQGSGRAGWQGLANAAGGSGGGKKPPGGNKKFLGPYAPGRGKKRKKNRNRKGKRAKKAKTAPRVPSDSDAESVSRTATTSPVSSVRSSYSNSPVNSGSESDADTDAHGRTKGKKKAKGKKKGQAETKTECMGGCQCWAGGRDATVRDFPEAGTMREQHHRQIIHTHQCYTSIFSKLNSISSSLDELKEESMLRDKKVADVLQHVQALSASKKFDEQRNKDIMALQLKFTTYTQLLQALDEEEEAMMRTLRYCNQDDGNDGVNFFRNYLKSIMETSLLYRMFLATEDNESGTHSFIFGQEYFRLPMKLQDMMFHYVMDKWPGNWRMSKCQKKLRSFLEYSRKTRSIQMRNFLKAKTKRVNCHCLYYAIYWEWEKRLKVFTRPAPLWNDCSDAARDDYFEIFEEDWNVAVTKKKLFNWDEDTPDQGQALDDEEQSRAERSKVAPKAHAEQYWEFVD